jgi:hypothetical protein
MVPGVELLGRAREAFRSFRERTGSRSGLGGCKKFEAGVLGIFAIWAERPENNSRLSKVKIYGALSKSGKVLKNNATICNRGIKRLYFIRLEAESGKGLLCVRPIVPKIEILRSMRWVPN